jgi:hypothetical protein
MALTLPLLWLAQACRYRVYAFDSAGKVLGECNTSNGYTIDWKIQVANKKAAWVLFRGQYEEETFTLRNPAVQGWVRFLQRLTFIGSSELTLALLISPLGTQR